MQQIFIRNAELNDIAALMKIERECFDCDTIENEMIYRERIKYFQDGFLILQSGKQVIGFICSEIWHDSSELTADKFALQHSIAKSLDMNGNTLYISSLAVSKDYRGCSFGEKLFQTLIKQIAVRYHGVTEALLLVGSSWKAAQNLYVKNGFEVCGELRNFFGGKNITPYNGIVMKKYIQR